MNNRKENDWFEHLGIILEIKKIFKKKFINC